MPRPWGRIRHTFNVSTDKRIWRLSAAAFATCGLGAILCYDWFRYHRLEHLSWAAALLAAIPVVLGPLMSGWAAFNVSSPRRISTPEELDLATRALADAIGRQWRVEAVMRGLLGGQPMNLRWADLTQTGSPKQQDRKKKAHLDSKHSRANEPSSKGMESRVDYLARKFINRGHRLVVVGAAGSGKTSLAILVLLHLLKHRNINDPMPVLLSLPDWDPREQDLYAWARSAILQEYPQLRASAYGGAAIDGLVGGRRVLLVLDGLDELPTELQSLAIGGINRALANDESIIITCRANQYRKLVNSGRNLASSQILELRSLECEDVRRFIECRVAQSEGGWNKILDALQEGKRGPLASTLSSPLFLYAFMAAYGERGNEAALLLDRATFPAKADVEAHLLDTLVPSLYANISSEAGFKCLPSNRVKLEHWLAILALNSRKLKTRNLSWWQIPYPIRRTTVCYAYGLLVATSIVVPMTTSGHLAWYVAWPILCMSAPAFYVFGRRVAYDGLPVAINLRMIMRLNELIKATKLNFPYLLNGPLSQSALAAVVTVTGFPARTAVAFSVSTLVRSGPMYIIFDWLTRPVEFGDPRSPRQTVRGDRRAAFVWFALIGIMTFLVMASIDRAWTALPIATFFAYWWVWHFSKWPRYAIAHVVLAINGYLPWRLHTFMEEAHRLGILRQEGASWQFRHSLLQDRLVETTSPMGGLFRVPWGMR
jgi:hypothetical protein